MGDSRRKRFRRISVCVIALMGMLTLPLFAGAAQKPAKAGPSIFIPQPTFNAGKVVEGAQITHTFIIKNKGTQKLIIKSVKPG